MPLLACSNASLQQQLRSCNEECHSSKRALLQTESQKLAMQQQVEQLQQQLRAASAEEGELQGTVCEL
jgi:septal ring factor EnvC (AmiA/AmiB activator)